MDRELTNLRRQLTHIERGRGRRYPATLRDRIARCTHARRAGKASWQDIAAELEIAVDTIKHGTRTGDAVETALVSVEVIAEVPGLGTGGHGGNPYRRSRPRCPGPGDMESLPTLVWREDLYRVRDRKTCIGFVHKRRGHSSQVAHHDCPASGQAVRHVMPPCGCVRAAPTIG